MAKGDFSVEENDFDINSNVENNNYNNSPSNNLYQMDYGANSDFSSIGINNNNNTNYYDNSDVLFEDESSQKAKDKINYKVSTLNKNVILLFVIIGIVLLASIIIIAVIVSNIKSSYKAEVYIPDIVYMDELENVSVLAKGKTDVSKTVTTFTSDKPNIISFVDEKLEGELVNNLIIPVQEGTAKISIKSVYGKKVLAKESKKVTVCRTFDASLITNKTLSVEVDSKTDLNINFGEEICSKGVRYQSLNEDILSVTAEGVATGVKRGTTTLKVYKDNRSFTVPVYVTGTIVYPNNMSVDKSTIQLKPEETKRLKVSFSPSTATTLFPTFKSRDASIAEVNDDGMITAISEGETSIIVKGNLIEEDVEVKVVVSPLISEQGSIATSLSLGIDKLTLNQGQSYVINPVVIPNNTKDKTITYSSSNEEVAGVNEYGVIYGKSEGQAIITAKTSNGIRKGINVSVIGLKAPILKTTDGVRTNLWHRKSYTIRFSGAPIGSIYKYGTNEEKLKEGTEIKVKSNGIKTFYVKACRNNTCGKSSSYISKVDNKKPKVLKVVSANSRTIKIVMSDSESLMDYWCIVTENNIKNCKWKKAPLKENALITHTVSPNQKYYIFAKDVAGNISDSYIYNS